jgi:H+/gluconate symporter-like permease
MKLLIGLIVAFLVLVYVYTFLKQRKKRRNHVDTVKKYNQEYMKNKKTKSAAANYSVKKYKGQIDYIEKDQLM